MLIVPRKRICTQQPQGAAQVDWSNPITRGLVYCGNSATTPGSKIACISGVSFSANQVAYQPGITIGANIPATEGLTLLSVGLINYANDGSNNNFGIRIGALNNYRFLVGVAGYSSKLQAYAKIQYTDYSVSTTAFANHGAGNRPLVLAATYERNQAAGLKCFANNAIIGSAATSDKNIFSEASPLVINSADGGSNNLIFPTLLNLYWSRSLSTEEVASISANPWQIFRAPDSRIFVPTGAEAGGGDSLTASSIIASPAIVGSPLLSQKHALTASSIATAPAVVASPAITQRHALSASAVSASPAVVGSPSITQRHALTATAISSGPAVIGSPTLTEIVAGVLSALPIVAAPAVVGSPAITQRHALSSGAISAGPATFGTPTLAQQHALMAQGITAAAAVVGSPILSEGGAVIFTSAPNGGGYSRSSENYTRPPQTNTVRH